MTGPTERRAFRAWVRRHHPDVGGDPAAFAAGLRWWRTGVTADPRPREPVAVFRVRGGLWPLWRWWWRRRPGTRRRVR